MNVQGRYETRLASGHANLKRRWNVTGLAVWKIGGGLGQTCHGQPTTQLGMYTANEKIGLQFGP